MADDEEAPPTPQWDGVFDEEGKPHGKGTVTYPPPPVNEEEEEEEEKPGDTFIGSFEHGSREGPGTYKWGNGAVFEGTYVDNKRNGPGKLTMPNKSLFTGNFTDDMMEGPGLYKYGNGDVYQGAFSANKRHGQGVYHFKDAGCQLVGNWVEGLFESGRWISKDGSIFQGTFAELAPVAGAYYFSRNSLIQKGTFAGGVWSAASDPFLGTAPQLNALLA